MSETNATDVERKIMELEIWNEPEPTKEPIRVRLTKGAENTVYLSAVDAKGDNMESGTIAVLRDDGLLKCRGLDPDLGFPLDEQGRIHEATG